MARRRHRKGNRANSAINITPLGDVSLSLLLGFLVITGSHLSRALGNRQRARQDAQARVAQLAQGRQVHESARHGRGRNIANKKFTSG